MKVKSVHDVIEEVSMIKGAKDDFECAHSDEDELYQKVLEEVVKGNPRARKMAELALKTKQLDFPRWCA